MILKSKIVAPLVLTMIFGGIFISSLLGSWNTTVSRQPSLILSGEAAGKPNPADVRGSFSFNDISKGYDIPLEDLKTAFALPDGVDAAAFQVKNLESLYADQISGDIELGAGAVRLFVAWYTGLPFAMTEEFYLPSSAVRLLKQRGKLTAEQIQYLDGHTLFINGETSTGPAVTATARPGPGTNIQHDPNARVVTGSTTFQQLLDWGVPQAAIENIIGGPMPNPAETVRNHVAQQGSGFGNYKQALQNEVDNIK